MMMKIKKIRHRFFVFRRILTSRIYRLLGSWNNRINPKVDYGIKPGYHHAKQAESYDDRINKDEWQREVYAFSLSRFQESGGETIIDVGCGSAYKLMNMFGSYSTLGIELTETWQWLVKNYPSRHWLSFEKAGLSELEADMVICSDVIEHLKNPDEMMEFLKKINFKSLVISTPERDRVRGNKDFGPPENTAHYREWNAAEFRNYISGWFEVREQIISNDKSASQILHCHHDRT